MMVADELVRNVTKAWGQGGAAWLDRLPALVGEIEERWSVRDREPFNASFSYVAPAVRQDGTEVVLKLGVPNGLHRREVDALGLFGICGSVRLLKSDKSLGVMMLERIETGAYHGDVPDEAEAISLAADMMRRFWQPAPSDHHFPEVSEYEGGLEWLRGQIDGTSPLPRPMVVRAEVILRALL